MQRDVEGDLLHIVVEEEMERERERESGVECVDFGLGLVLMWDICGVRVGHGGPVRHGGRARARMSLPKSALDLVWI